MLYVCSLARLHETTEDTGAKTLVTLISGGTQVERPLSIAADDHLFLAFNDIVEPMEGMVPPALEHVESLIEFGHKWTRAAPMVVHCWAGISRSTAAAYIIGCARNPDRDEVELARALRSASPSATPNSRLVAFADELLGRDGRMVRAIREIGRGESAYEGTPFLLDIT